MKSGKMLNACDFEIMQAMRDLHRSRVERLESSYDVDGEEDSTHSFVLETQDLDFCTRILVEMARHNELMELEQWQ